MGTHLLCTLSPASCTFGTAPSSLMFLPTLRIFGSAGPIGSAIDMIPFVNILPFGLCVTLLNPMTAGLTAAAFGVLTPAPCIPFTVAPWLPGNPVVTCAGIFVTNTTSTLICGWTGIISPISSTQVTAFS